MPLPSQGGYRRRDNHTGRVVGSSSRGVRIGRPDTAFTQGPLQSPDNVVSVWRGPAWGIETADLGWDMEVHYAVADCNTDDFVVCEWIDGRWYVAPLEC